MAEEFHADVATETYSDHVILRPPNRLKARVARRVDPLAREADPVRRAEHALSLLENEFDNWMTLEVDRLETARRNLLAKADAHALGELYRSCHDIRGQAATLGFPLAGEVADGLCDLIDALEGATPPQSLVDRHVEAIRAMVREGVRGRDSQLGAALVEHLRGMRARIMPAGAEDR